MYQPKISALVTNLSYSATLNASASPYVRREILNGPSYFFPDDDEVILREDLTELEEGIYEEVWAEVLKHYEESVLPKRTDELRLNY